MDNRSHRRLNKIQITRSAGYITIKNGLDKYHQQYEGYLLFSNDEELCIKSSWKKQRKTETVKRWVDFHSVHKNQKRLVTAI